MFEQTSDTISTDPDQTGTSCQGTQVANHEASLVASSLPVWALADLLASGISAEAAADAGIYPVNSEQYGDLLGFTFKEMPDGYAIPFTDPTTGQPMKTPGGKPFIRVKLRTPVSMGDSLAKYLSPKDGGGHAYIPAAVIKADQSEPLVITEGEKKALSACLNGIPTIGLIGVFGFVNSTTKDLHSELHSYISEGREVTFIVDSDAACNHDIALAAHRFNVCAALRGCKLRVLVMPPNFEFDKEGKIQVVKVGMDDFIMRHGADSIRELLKSARPIDGSVDDLYCEWFLEFARLCAAEKVEASIIANEIVRKGYFDKTVSAVRREIIHELTRVFPDLPATIDACIRQKLEIEFVQAPVPEHGGGNLIVGRYARVPGYNETLKIDALQDDVAWCFLPESNHASRPFFRRHLELATRERGGAENGVNGGRPPAPTVTEMANACLSQGSITIDGICTLRLLRGQWYQWNGRHYARIPEQDVRGVVMQFLRQHPLYSAFATTKTLTDILNQLKAHDAAGMPSDTDIPAWITDAGLESAKGWLAMDNGAVNIENLARVINGEHVAESDLFRPHSPRLFTPHGLPYEFDLDAKGPTFEKYLMEVQPDPEAREVIQMLMGLCLVADTSFNVFFILHGRGGEGKSVFLHILVSLVGTANVAHVPFSKFGDKFSIGLLTENLLNVIGEGDTELPRDAGLGRIEGVLKDACDGGLMPVEHKFQEPGHARATARCIAATNSLPAFYDRSEAIWDRMRVIPFTERIRGTGKEDPRLRNKIVDGELSGIFNFAVAGLAKLRKLTRFPETPAGVAMKADHRSRCDHEREFLTEHFQAGSDGDMMPTQAAYLVYRSWMTARSYHPLGEANFGASVQRVFPMISKAKPRIDGKQVHAWIGLKQIEEVA